METLYQLSTTVRDVFSASLQKKGYRYQASGGDFVVSYAFGARLEGGIDPGMPNPAPTSSVINRSPDPAVMDNAYALSGLREVTSLMLSFEDGDNLASVWSARWWKTRTSLIGTKFAASSSRASRELPDVPTR